MKSLAEQTVGQMGGVASVLSRQKRDHVALDELLNRLDQAPPEEQPPVLLRIYRLVFPHAFAEEAVLWPVIRRVLPDGHALTLRIEREHQEISELVARVEGIDPASTQRQKLLARVVETLRQDVRDEEDELLPRLQAELTPDRLRRLGRAWEAVRRIAPTRAHPVVSRRPPGNVLSALPLSVLDRCRDRVDARLHRVPRGRGVLILQAVSRALRSASHAVERLPGMRRGEDPATRLKPGSPFRWGTAAVVTVAVVWTLAAVARRQRLRSAASGSVG